MPSSAKYVSHIFWPDFSNDQLMKPGLLVGWNLRNFRCCIAALTTGLSLDEVTQALDEIVKTHGKNANKKYHPVILGQWVIQTDEKDGSYAEMKRQASLWVTLTKDCKHDTLPKLHSLYSNGCSYSDSECIFLRYSPRLLADDTNSSLSSPPVYLSVDPAIMKETAIQPNGQPRSSTHPYTTASTATLPMTSHRVDWTDWTITQQHLSCAETLQQRFQNLQKMKDASDLHPRKMTGMLENNRMIQVGQHEGARTGFPFVSDLALYLCPSATSGANAYDLSPKDEEGKRRGAKPQTSPRMASSPLLNPPSAVSWSRLVAVMHSMWCAEGGAHGIGLYGSTKMRKATVLVTDMCMGVLVSYTIYTHFSLIVEWTEEKAVSLVLRHFLDALEALQHAPIGIKFDPQLAARLSYFFAKCLNTWRWVLHHTRAVSLATMLVVGSGVGGLRLQVAALQDILKVASAPMLLIADGLQSYVWWHVQCIASLLYLFQGLKWNILRLRVDSLDCDRTQLLLGTATLVILVFLLPTFTAYLLLFRIVGWGVAASLFMLNKVIEVITITQFPARTGIALRPLYSRDEGASTGADAPAPAPAPAPARAGVATAQTVERISSHGRGVTSIMSGGASVRYKAGPAFFEIVRKSW